MVRFFFSFEHFHFSYRRTMTGPPNDPGVNFRAIETVFALAEEQATFAKTQSVHPEEEDDISLEVAILEIYNETIRDLLAPASQKKKLDVHVASGQCEVPGVVRRPVRSAADVAALIAAGAKHRAVGSHDMNAESSRSHQVVTLYITRQSVTSKLHLVDLAGSERLAKTDVSAPDMVRETQNINKSLSALGDVISALASGNNQKSSPGTPTHVPYRNSKLTFFLQDSLSGDSKALMVVNVSPAPADVPETLCSLKFAARCRRTALGKAKRKTVSTPVRPPSSRRMATPNTPNTR